MARIFLPCAVFVATGLMLLAGEDPKKPKDDPVKKEIPKEGVDPKGKDPKDKDKEEEDILTRVHQNMVKVGDRLDKKDYGDQTRQIQRDIVRDLDELIKQLQNPDDSQSSGGASQDQNPDQKKENNPNQNQAGNTKGGPKNNQGPKDNPDAKEKLGPAQIGKGNDSQEKKGPFQPGKGGMGDPKEPGAGQTAGGGGNPKVDKGPTPSQYKGIWGDLPPTRRQEMDVYARERFLPRYEELLRQYYRSISEHGRGKEGE